MKRQQRSLPTKLSYRVQRQERHPDAARGNLGGDPEENAAAVSFGTFPPAMSRRESSASTSFGTSMSLGNLRAPVPESRAQLTGGRKRTSPQREQGRRGRQQFSSMPHDELVQLLEGQSGDAEEEADRAPTLARRQSQLATEAGELCSEGSRTFQRRGATPPEMEQAKQEFNANAWDRRESCLQDPGGWKAVVCWKLVPERMPAMSRPDLRNLHVLTRRWRHASTRMPQ